MVSCLDFGGSEKKTARRVQTSFRVVFQCLIFERFVRVGVTYVSNALSNTSNQVIFSCRNAFIRIMFDQYRIHLKYSRVFFFFQRRLLTKCAVHYWMSVHGQCVAVLRVFQAQLKSSRVLFFCLLEGLLIRRQ